MLNSLLIMALGALTPTPVNIPDHFSATLLQDVYHRVDPTLGIITYSEEVTDSDGEVSKQENTALGVVVSSDGLVMAHGHMQLEQAVPFHITMKLQMNGREKEYPLTLLRKPVDINVVFLKVQSQEPLKLPYVKFTQDHHLQLGAPVALVGLLSETLDFRAAVHEARVGAVLERPRMTFALDDSVRFGFVGGPVVNTRGDVVGIVGYDLSRNEGGDLYVRSGHPLIYQADLFAKYISNPPSPKAEAKPENGTTDEAWLGVLTQPLTAEFTEYWKLPEHSGLIVSTVVPSSPAEKVGLKPGDIITEFNGSPVQVRVDREVLSFTKLVRDAGAGSKVKMRVLRDGAPLELDVTVGSRPVAGRDAGEFEDNLFGLTVRELTTDVRMNMNLEPAVQGVIVRRVRSGSTAQLAKLRPNVIIMRLGEYPVTNIQDFKDAISKVAAEAAQEVPVFGRVGTATGFFRLAPRWQAAENEK